MRRFLCLFVGFFLLFSNAYAVTNHGNICSVLSNHPSWYQIAKETERKWGVPVQVQMAIMRTESDFRANAKARTTSAYGYAQAVNGTWKAYLKENNTAGRRNDFRAASDFIGWYANQLNAVAGVSTSNPYQLYVAYHEGGGGYKHPSALAKRVAKRVAQDAQNYRAQLSSCSDFVENDPSSDTVSTASLSWKTLAWMQVSL